MRQIWLCVAIVIILLNGCSSASTDTPAIPATDQPSVSIVRSPTKTANVPTPVIPPTTVPTATIPPVQPSTTPSPTFTPSKTDVDTSECVFASKFVDDVTLPDGCVLPSGQQVEKIWRVRNTGTCSWGEGTSIIHIKANKFDAPARIPVPSAQPGDEVDIRITFTTPNRSGIYESYWRLENTKNELFGGVLYIRLNTSGSIEQSILPLPSTTPESTATAVPAPTDTPASTDAPTSTGLQEPTATPILDCGDYNPQFMGVLSQASLLGLDVGCAMGAIYQSTGTVQEFWFNIDSQDAEQRLRSLLIQNNDTRTLYVLVGKDILTYEANIAIHEGSESNSDGKVCGAPIPPDGYFIPQNCFTQVWCENQYWKTAGWPRLKHATADLVMQKTGRGILIRVSALPTNVYYLALDLETKRGTVQMGP